MLLEDEVGGKVRKRGGSAKRRKMRKGED